MSTTSALQQVIHGLQYGSYSSITEIMHKNKFHKQDYQDIANLANGLIQKLPFDNIQKDQLKGIMSLAYSYKANPPKIDSNKPSFAPSKEVQAFDQPVQSSGLNVSQDTILSSFTERSGKILTISLFGFALLGLQTIYSYNVAIFGVLTLITIAIPGSYVIGKYAFNRGSQKTQSV